VVKNLDAKRLKDTQKKSEFAEVQKLKNVIRTAIEKKGYDLAKMFKLFDTNGDGTFDQMEFEAAFNVLEIEVKVNDLRRLIVLGDKNADGKIDFPEFNEMLYSAEPDELGGFVSDDGSDID
jgi:Ca2+-binding EF-hand superfamily protein